MFLVELGTHLQNALVGTLGVDMFLAFMPDTPDLVTCLFEYAGSGPVDLFGNDTLPAWDRISVQVRVRGEDRGYLAAHAKATEVFKVLTKISNETIEGGEYFRVSKINGPYLMAVDQQDRPIIAQNFEVWRKP